ncbi:MAG: hypothetical protein ACP5HZ_11805, partial [Ferrimicrobium sp.]
AATQATDEEVSDPSSAVEDAEEEEEMDGLLDDMGVNWEDLEEFDEDSDFVKAAFDMMDGRIVILKMR